MEGKAGIIFVSRRIMHDFGNGSQVTECQHYKGPELSDPKEIIQAGPHILPVSVIEASGVERNLSMVN